MILAYLAIAILCAFVGHSVYTMYKKKAALESKVLTKSRCCKWRGCCMRKGD